MANVYVIGAGASRGESLRQLPDLPPGHPELHPQSPPLTNGFFNKDLLDALAYPQAGQDFSDVVDHIRKTKLLEDAFGEGAWKTLDLEEIFTSLEIERDFQNPESNGAAHALLTRNKLIRYIRRIIGLCTQYTYGEYYKRLVAALRYDDSIVTFNWDLLLDQEFIKAGRFADQYCHYLLTVDQQDTNHLMVPITYGAGFFLKLHGSLNWFRCGNHRCQGSRNFTFVPNIQQCLSIHEGIGEAMCWQCGSEMNPLIIPPLLRKPITEDSVIRNAWGLARTSLLAASKVVLIGFSAAPTDFYTSWLLRSTVGTRQDVEVVVINPSNREDDKNHLEFTRRMNAIFLRGYDSGLSDFKDVAAVLPDASEPRAEAVT